MMQRLGAGRYCSGVRWRCRGAWPPIPPADIPGIPQYVVQRDNDHLPCFLDDEDRQATCSVCWAFSMQADSPTSPGSRSAAFAVVRRLATAALENRGQSRLFSEELSGQFLDDKESHFD